MLIKLYNGDCIDIMRDMPDKSVDMILTDPPYGIGRDKGSYGFGTVKGRKYAGGWDKHPPSEMYFAEMLRIAKNAIIFGGNYFASMLPNTKGWIVWDKKCDIAFKNPFADCELIYTTYNRVVKKYSFKQQGFISDSNDKRVHPTQKPSELLQMIISDYAADANTIFDPFMGSGSTGVAAIDTGRDFIGIEIDKGYYDIAEQRINDAASKHDGQKTLC